MPATHTTYDAIPYQSNPFPQSHPDRLSAIAKLFGLDAPDTDDCRVLELGCSMGGNLVAMAQLHPGSQFVGIDASSRQIADGWKMIDRLGLRNVRLQHLDILDIDASLGEFDYIVSHGVFSWVPVAVQDKMLDLCRRLLVANGVAYISYNTYPGWHIRGIVRDMMLFRSVQFADPPTRLAQAKALVEFVAKSSGTESDPYKQLLQGEFRTLGRSDDYYLHHDHLEENNHPLYFHEFARRLGVNGLQYLGEADFPTMVSTNFAPEVAKTLFDLGAHDIVQMEQYMDFVRCRYFRQTLICHSAAQLNRQLRPEVVKDLWFSSQAVPEVAAGKDTPSDMETFRTPSGRGISCRSALTRNALRVLLRKWPMSVPFRELFVECKALATKAGAPANEATDEEFFAGEMLACLAAGVMEWRLTPDRFTTAVSQHPASSPAARIQAALGSRVTTLRGEAVTLDEIHRSVLRHLDGKVNVTHLPDTVLKFLIEGGHQLRRDGDNSPVTDPEEMRGLLGPALDKVLENLARMALLTRVDGAQRNARGRGRADASVRRAAPRTNPVPD